MDMSAIARIINAILTAAGLFLGWQGAYNLISSKTEHKPDQGADSWWTIGLGVFCIATAQSNFIGQAFSALTF